MPARFRYASMIPIRFLRDIPCNTALCFPLHSISILRTLIFMTLNGPENDLEHAEFAPGRPSRDSPLVIASRTSVDTSQCASHRSMTQAE